MRMLTEVQDGLTLGDGVLAKPNPLFVVNGRTNLVGEGLREEARAV